MTWPVQPSVPSTDALLGWCVRCPLGPPFLVVQWLCGLVAALALWSQCLVAQGDGSYEIVTDLVLNDELVAKIKKVRTALVQQCTVHSKDT